MVSEISISASCPEAARRIYGSPEKIRFLRKELPEETSVADAGEDVDDEELEDEAELGAFLLCVRDEAIGILQDRERELAERIRRFLAHAELVQEAINAWEADGEELPGEISGATDVPDEAEDAGERYRHFLIRRGSYSGLASIGEKWADRIRLIYDAFVGTENDDFSGRYIETTDNIMRSLTKENRLYEYEHLLVYYAFLLLNRSIDDYDYLGKAKLVVLSYLMNKDMDAAVFLKKGILSKEDREKNARIYAREVEHAEENLADLFEEILFERAYDSEGLCAGL